jgi:hypothetical protein
MKSPLTRSLRKQTPMNKKAITYVTAEKSKFTHYENKNAISNAALLDSSIYASSLRTNRQQ